MKTYIDCVPCFARQILDTVKRTGEDPTRQKEITNAALMTLARLDYEKSPPQLAMEIHQTIREMTGGRDLYKEIKHWSNTKALEMLDKLHEEINASECKFETALRLAIAGNIIDFGAKSHVSDDMIDQAIAEAMTVELDKSEIEKLKAEIEKAGSILYLLDNAGEIVFDRLLIEQLPCEKVTAVVRGGAIINDVTMEDAREVGLTDIVRVIDNGSAAPGTILEISSQEFTDVFNNSDLIISKGQGNFETMNTIDKNIFFLLKVKCPIVANTLDMAIGTMVLTHQNDLYRK